MVKKEGKQLFISLADVSDSHLQHPGMHMQKNTNR